jgi:hypothetical protein
MRYVIQQRGTQDGLWANHAAHHRGCIRMTWPCKPDSSGANWFRCAQGTVGCPRIHDGRTPHCIACTAGDPCGHNPPVLEERSE